MSAIDPTLPAAIPRAPTAAVRTPKATLDQGDFLTLMTAQLKNQDPTKPVDNLQYVQQMAMFSQLAGTTETNSKVGETNSKLAAITDRLDKLIAATTAKE
ncbi:MAG: flagellar hook assembly protein FlgD [Sandarakinorhabdus sp.]|jgi:flagellar basal-body rod modification protein FlgD